MRQAPIPEPPSNVISVSRHRLGQPGWIGLRPFACIALLCAGSACRSGPRVGGAQPLPQAYLEKQLRGRVEPDTRSEDGRLLYHAELSAANANALRAPYDRLQEYCRTRSGGWVPIGPPRISASQAAAGKAPNDIVARLADADSGGVFGSFRCESSSTVWNATIEPSELETTPLADRFSLRIFVKAALGSAPLDEEAWPPPGPAANSGRTPERIQLPAGAPPVVSAPSSPFNQQPSRPAAVGDELLADPRPFGIDMGNDSLDVFASKLRVDPAQSRCAGASQPATSELCFAKPGGSEALELNAHFVDLGLGPVVSQYTLRYPAASFGWLERMLRNDYGPADAGSASGQRLVWSWIHTRIELRQGERGECVFEVQHPPSLERARLPADAGRDMPGPVRLATPWQLQLGYEPAQLAQTKLQTAGFTIAANGCKDGGALAKPILTRICPLSGGKMDGLRTAEVTIVDPGDGRPRLAQLSYKFDKRVLNTTYDELRTQYGPPLPQPDGASLWWTGPVGIEVSPHADGFGLRYFHGRLLQYYSNADQLNRGQEKASQRQGL